MHQRLLCHRASRYSHTARPSKLRWCVTFLPHAPHRTLISQSDGAGKVSVTARPLASRLRTQRANDSEQPLSKRFRTRESTCCMLQPLPASSYSILSAAATCSDEKEQPWPREV
mmetsp:Transcript_20427/g.62244  ORF Transcript_20427/g.62244 Transcript_20427/m.62244 type:complete len:114 (-) Transcript_20427:651-992(-)|eukprot:scaffold82208_cov35-Tisochrysis_lutea.AAC.1